MKEQVSMKKLSQKRLAELVLFSRKAKKMTQQQLSEATGINRTMLSHLESGEYIPSIPQLEALSETLDFDLTEVFLNFDKTGSGKLESRNRLCRPFGFGPSGPA